MIRPFRPASKYVQNTWHQQLNVLKQNSIPLSLINWFVSFHGASHCLIITCTWHILSLADLCMCVWFISCMRVSIKFMLVLVHFHEPASRYTWMNSLETVQYWKWTIAYNNLRDVISFEFCLAQTSCHTSIIPHELHSWSNKGYQALSYDQLNRSTWEQD